MALAATAAFGQEPPAANQTGPDMTAAAANQTADAADESGGLQEIVVTARKRAENVQEVPVAISAVSGDQLERLDVSNAMDLSALVPNFQAPRNTVSFSAPQFYMRGAGRANNNWNAENAVAVFLDDIYLQSTAGAYIDMIDMERVEVLRGPQGTLYGRNATTGAIKFIPRKPDLDKTRVIADVTYGSHERLDLKGSVSVPLVEDKLGAKLDLFRTATDGYLTRVNEANVTLDKDFAHQEHYGGRLSFLFKPTEDLTFEFAGDYVKQDNGTNLVTPIVPPNRMDLTQLLSKRGTVDFKPLFGPNRAATEPLTGNGGAKFEGYGVVFKASLDTAIGTLKSISGYREYDDYFLSQLSGRGVPSTIFGVTLYSTVDSDNDYQQFTQEFQLTGDVGDKLKYVVGAYYFDNDWAQVQYGSTVGIPANFSVFRRPGQTQSFGGSVQDTRQIAKSYALYFDGSYELIDGLSLLFGGRQTWDRKKVDYDVFFEDGVTRYPGFPVFPKKRFKRFTPKIGINWEATDDLLVYATYAEGYKAGNLEGDRATDPAKASNFLKPEVVKTYEAGLKADWFDRRLRTNLAVFTSSYDNKADLISPQEVAIADAEINGIEAEISLVPTEGLRLWVNAGFLDAKYKSADADHPIFQPDPTGFVLGLKAEPVVTPKYSYTAGVDYSFDLAGGRLSLGTTLQAVGKHFNGLGVQNYDSELVKAYEVVDAQVTYEFPGRSLSITAGVNNLFDKTYYTTGFFGAVPEYAGRYYADDRNWFVRARYEF